MALADQGEDNEGVDGNGDVDEDENEHEHDSNSSSDTETAPAPGTAEWFGRASAWFDGVIETAQIEEEKEQETAPAPVAGAGTSKVVAPGTTAESPDLLQGSQRDWLRARWKNFR